MSDQPERHTIVVPCILCETPRIRLCKDYSPEKDSGYCRSCVQKVKHPTKQSREEFRQYQKRWYQANKESHCAKGAIYRKSKAEYERERHRRYRAENRQVIRKKGQEYYASHREERAAYAAAHAERKKHVYKIYRRTHPEIFAYLAKRRRARKAQAPINDLTVAQWQEIKAAYRFRCVYCGKKPSVLTQDHITPLSKNGSHTASNIVPACQSCNSKKKANAPLVAVQPLFLTVAPSKS
jgi:5-methylcytosine-specific restriction endonuclease McrA